MKHGTRQAYSKHRCRCDECRHAQLTYYREYQRFRRDPDADEAGLKLPRIDGLPVGEWVARAACRGQVDLFEVPNWWAPKRGYDRTPEVVAAKRICWRCPVLEQCRTWITDHYEDPCPAHVVAGMTKQERRIYRKELGLSVPGRVSTGGTAA